MNARGVTLVPLFDVSRKLPAQDVADQLGHTDGGALVQRLYGHPSERLARERVKRATAGKSSIVVSLTGAKPGQP
jgi:hypothetical protein